MTDEKENKELQPVEENAEKPSSQQSEGIRPERPQVEYSSSDNEQKHYEYDQEAEQPAENFSSVAASPASKKFMYGGLGVVGVVMGYYLIQNFGSDPNVQQTPKPQDIELQKKKDDLLKDAKPAPVIQQDAGTEAKQVVKVPEPSPVQIPETPEPPAPPVPTAPQAPLFPQNNNPGVPGAPQLTPPAISSSPSFALNANNEEEQKKLDARRKAGIMVLGGGAEQSQSGDASKAGGAGEKKSSEKKERPNSSFLGFGEGAFSSVNLAKTAAPQVSATYVGGKLDTMVLQGKIINAVLETAINTDLPGTLRAVISRDVYGESGKTVLIPKGSRVVGTYDNSVKGGQTRVGIVWDRVIRPDGIDIAINSQGVDSLGRTGTTGLVDDKVLMRLSTAFLISYIVPIYANKLSKVNNNEQVQTTTTTNATTNTSSTTSSSSVKTQQMKEASDKFKDIATKVIEESFNTNPTIYVDQGTEINIFVNRDLIFPPEVAITNMKVMK